MSGAELLAGSRSAVLQLAEVVARTHHERWDGSGYGARLRGEAIPLAGRIVAVADVFDALTTTRSYKSAWTAAAAVAEIRAQSGRHFDPQVVAAYLAALAGGAVVDSAVRHSGTRVAAGSGDGRAQADTALYAANRAGCNRVRAYGQHEPGRDAALRWATHAAAA